MKHLTSAFVVGALLLVLTGCCCDSSKQCTSKHQHTAQCSGSECTDEKKDNSTGSQTTASADTEDQNKKDNSTGSQTTASAGTEDQNNKEHTQPQSKKISAR